MMESTCDDGVRAPADVAIEAIADVMADVERTHVIFDHASVPRTGQRQEVLTIEQRAAILVHWYRKGR